MCTKILTEHNIIQQNGKINPNASKILNNNPKIKDVVLNATSFLPSISTIRERLYCIKNDITSPVLCPMCSTPVNIKKTGRLEYPTYCSRTCMQQDRHTIQKKIKQTTKTYNDSTIPQ